MADIREKIIICEWIKGNIETSYQYFIMEDAIVEKCAEFFMYPNWMYKGNFRLIYDRIKNKNNFCSKLLYKQLIPKNMDKNTRYIILFNEWNPFIKNNYFLQWLRSNYDVKLVLVIRNMIPNKLHPGRNGITVNSMKILFDLVVTDEKVDAEMYGLLFLPDPLSHKALPKENDSQYDICFIGADKGRLPLIKEISKAAIEHNVTYNIKVAGKRRFSEAIDFTEYMPYVDVIKHDMNANCIVEIMQPGQDSYTLRYQEAVCMNKKLLTNNPNVLTEKYYDPRYIQYFNSVSDIDWDFVKEKDEVNYRYEGDFSPIKFLDSIRASLNYMEMNKND